MNLECNDSHFSLQKVIPLISKYVKPLGYSSLTFFQKNKIICLTKDKEGFYIYAKPNLCDTDTVIKYISRYDQARR